MASTENRSISIFWSPTPLATVNSGNCHADDGVFSRDLIDLAMIDLELPLLRQAVIKAEAAYGHSIRRDLNTAIERIHQRPGWLERCMQAMAIDIPQALLWQKIRALKRL